jgi:hypothetical protein
MMDKVKKTSSFNYNLPVSETIRIDRLKVFKNRMPRRVFGLKKEEVTGC